MLVPNAIFRANGAAVLLSNKASDSWWGGGRCGFEGFERFEWFGVWGFDAPVLYPAQHTQHTQHTHHTRNYRRAKYHLDTLVRTTIAKSDEAFQCVYQCEDGVGESPDTNNY